MPLWSHQACHFLHTLYKFRFPLNLVEHGTDTRKLPRGIAPSWLAARWRLASTHFTGLKMVDLVARFALGRRGLLDFSQTFQQQLALHGTAFLTQLLQDPFSAIHRTSFPLFHSIVMGPPIRLVA